MQVDETLFETSIFHIAISTPGRRDVKNEHKYASGRDPFRKFNTTNTPVNRDVKNVHKYASGQDFLRHMYVPHRDKHAGYS